jgi:redox-sensing transcriptional repressor
LNPGRACAILHKASEEENSLLDISPLTLNRLGVYRRALRELERAGVRRISSQELADRFHLSAAQIRKDLAHFGELGIRGVGYEVPKLTRRLSEILGLDRKHRMVVVGMGNLGSALASYLGFNSGAFHVVGGVDNDPEKVGRKIRDFEIRPTEELAAVIRDTGAEVGVLTVPAEAAQENYDLLVKAGVKGVLNFAPVRVEPVPGVPLKQVDLRSQLEELAFYLRD